MKKKLIFYALISVVIISCAVILQRSIFKNNSPKPLYDCETVEEVEELLGQLTLHMSKDNVEEILGVGQDDYSSSSNKYLYNVSDEIRVEVRYDFKLELNAVYIIYNNETKEFSLPNKGII